MDMARTALRSAAEGKQAPGSGAAAKLSEMLASKAPSVNVSGLQKIGADALFKVSEVTRDLGRDIGDVTRDGFSNLVGGSWDPLGPPVVGASGPIARDISTIYESTLENRKQMGSNITNFQRIVEAKTPTMEGRLKGGSDRVSQCRKLREECQGQTQHITSATEAVRGLCKSVQEKLQCETTTAATRDKALEERAAKVEGIKKEHGEETNKRREKMEEEFKEREAQLSSKYSSDETEGFV